MGVLGAFGSLTRDFIQYILPTIIGMTLFVPFFVPKGNSLSVDVAVLLCFILGYVIYLPIYDLATRVHDKLPIRSLSLNSIKQQRIWCARNWNYDVLWVQLDKDEREYLYLTSAYIVFSQISAMYFLIYSLFNAILLIKAILSVQNFALIQFYNNLINANTPMLGGWSLPTLLIFPLALILTRYLYLNVIGEYEIMYGEDGFLVQFASKYQQDRGGIAQSIWGLVVAENQHHNQAAEEKQKFGAVWIQLIGPDDSLIAKAETNQFGYFQMPGIYQSCLGKRCRLNIEDENWEGSLEITLTPKAIPSFEVIAHTN